MCVGATRPELLPRDPFQQLRNPNSHLRPGPSAEASVDWTPRRLGWLFEGVRCWLFFGNLFLSTL